MTHLSIFIFIYSNFYSLHKNPRVSKNLKIDTVYVTRILHSTSLIFYIFFFISFYFWLCKLALWTQFQSPRSSHFCCLLQFSNYKCFVFVSFFLNVTTFSAFLTPPQKWLNITIFWPCREPAQAPLPGEQCCSAFSCHVIPCMHCASLLSSHLYTPLALLLLHFSWIDTTFEINTVCSSFVCWNF